MVLWHTLPQSYTCPGFLTMLMIVSVSISQPCSTWAGQQISQCSQKSYRSEGESNVARMTCQSFKGSAQP